jgi:hypothetical protein
MLANLRRRRKRVSVHQEQLVGRDDPREAGTRSESPPSSFRYAGRLVWTSRGRRAAARGGGPLERRSLPAGRPAARQRPLFTYPHNDQASMMTATGKCYRSSLGADAELFERAA